MMRVILKQKITENSMSRGRPTEQTEARTKYILEIFEYPSKPELGSKQVWHFDKEKSSNGAWRVENFDGPDEKPIQTKPQKGKAHSNTPVVMVFKTSKNANARTKMKIWRNENIDYILTTPKLPGIPNKAVILEIGVGDTLIEKYKLEYNL